MNQIASNNTPRQTDCQNSIETNPYFKEIVLLINTENFNKKTLLNTIRKLIRSENGKIVARSLPHLSIDNNKYEEIGAVFGISKETARQYIKEGAPSVFYEKARGGDVA